MWKIFNISIQIADMNTVYKDIHHMTNTHQVPVKIEKNVSNLSYFLLSELLSVL